MGWWRWWRWWPRTGGLDAAKRHTRRIHPRDGRFDGLHWRSRGGSRAVVGAFALWWASVRYAWLPRAAPLAFPRRETQTLWSRTTNCPHHTRRNPGRTAHKTRKNQGKYSGPYQTQKRNTQTCNARDSYSDSKTTTKTKTRGPDKAAFSKRYRPEIFYAPGTSPDHSSAWNNLPPG